MIARYSDAKNREPNSLDRLMAEFLGDKNELRAGWAPPVDIKETGTEINIQADLPGMSPDDIEIEMVGEALSIRGKREFSADERKDDYVRRERFFGTFQRTFTLGTRVKPDQISATFKDGVLTVVVPKADEVQPRKISIARQ